MSVGLVPTEARVWVARDQSQDASEATHTRRTFVFRHSNTPGRWLVAWGEWWWSRLVTHLCRNRQKAAGFARSQGDAADHKLDFDTLVDGKPEGPEIAASAGTCTRNT